MAIAEIITIGTELLLGEIQDTNSKYLARVLRDIGVDLYRLTTVGDNPQRIAATITEALTRADIVITTGGLGPTIDDPTRQAVAEAMEVELEYQPELWEVIISRFKRYNRQPSENNKRQAFIPKGATVIENMVGTAPAFVFESKQKSIISLPGVPREMEYITQNFVLNYLKTRYLLENTIIKARVLHTISLGESSIDEIIGDLELLSNPTVGLLAHPGQTDIRVTAKASSEQTAEAMMQPIIEMLYAKLGNYIYGEDETKLEEAVVNLLNQHNLRINIIDSGLNGQILSRLIEYGPERINGSTINGPVSKETLIKIMKESSQQDVDLVLGVRFQVDQNRQVLYLALSQGNQVFEGERSFGGPPGDAPLWAFNSALDFIRRKMLEN